jgi:hypothetical protein
MPLAALLSFSRAELSKMEGEIVLALFLLGLVPGHGNSVPRFLDPAALGGVIVLGTRSGG